MNEKLDRLAGALPGNRDPYDWLDLVRELELLGVFEKVETCYLIRDPMNRYWHPIVRVWGKPNPERTNIYRMKKQVALEEARYLEKTDPLFKEFLIETRNITREIYEKVQIDILSLWHHWRREKLPADTD